MLPQDIAHFSFGTSQGYCIVLYCTVLYCTVLYCTVLYCTVLYCTVLYCTVLYCTVLYCIVKRYVLYSAVTGPWDCSKCFYTLLPSQTCSIKYLLNLSGKHPAICSYPYPPLCIARYSFIKLSELEQCRVKKLAHNFNIAAQNSNPGSRSREFVALPLSHCALLYIPYRIVSYRIVSYRIVSYRTVPYRTVPYRTVPYRTVPYRTVPYRIVLPFIMEHIT